MKPQFIIKKDGKRAFVVLSIEDYEELVDAAEIRAAKDEDTLPHHIVKKLVIDEENPVKVLREYRGMTQGELAKAAGYSSNNYISMLENGQRVLNDKALKNIAAALNIDPDYLTQ
tara:strand:- start:319 stop:663 length:345 start_codon:yes stop_codon:yes gene_type:complete